MCRHTMCSSSLLQTHVSEVYSFPADGHFPFLNTGVILAPFQSVGTVPVRSDCSKSTCRTGASSSASSFNSRHGTSSGPARGLVGVEIR